MFLKKISSSIPTIVVLFLFACSASKKTANVQHKTLGTITISAKNNPMDRYRASAPHYWDIIHTRVALAFDYKNKTADGKAWIQLRPYFYATDTLLLDAKSMDIDSVMIATGSNYTPLKYTYANDKLKIDFNKQYLHNELIELYIKYTAKPYAQKTGGSKAITDDRGLYFINTNNEIPNKPMQIWTQGETESNSHWLPTLDQPNERMTVQIELTVPDSFKTLSNGAMIGSKSVNKNLRTDIWNIQQPIQIYAIMFAIGNFEIVADKSWNDVKVNYYVEPQYAPYAKKMFNNTPEMMAYFSTITGVPYPWNKYSQIVVRDYVSGAMENTTASLFGEFMNQNFREIADKNFEDIVSHELFHQWFGDYVTAESWSNLTVNESFANYGEQLWRLHKYGKASNDELYYNDLTNYLNQTEYNDEPLVRFHYRKHEDMFDRISYQKGGAILHYLHSLIGDDAFYKAMNIYLTKNALQSAEAHNWRMAVEEATGQDWNWFFDQWYFRGAHPVLNITYDDDDKAHKLTVNVNQQPSDSGKAYTLPLKAALIYGNEKKIIDWNINSKQQRFVYDYKNDVKPLFIPDYEHWLVGIIREKKTTSQSLQQLISSEDYINKRRAVTNAFMHQNDSVAQNIFHEALKDSLVGIRAYALTLLHLMPDKHGWYKNFKNEVLFLAINDGSNRVRAAAFDVLGKWKIETATPEIIQVLSDSSYMVAGSALEALQRIAKDTAYSFAKNILTQKPKADLENAAWSVVAFEGNADDTTLFTQKVNDTYGSKKISLAGNLYLYSLYTKNIHAFEKSLQTITALASNENIKSYRFAIGSLVFATVNYYKEQIAMPAASEKMNELKNRLSIAEKYRQHILLQEGDAENLKKYQSL